MFLGGGKMVNEEVAFLWVLIGEEGIDFGNTGNPANQIQVDATHESCVA